MAHLAGVDLNLLPLLDALLNERQLTRAARTVGLSQPAASRALARLRTLLADPLLVRAGAGHKLTTRAEALREPVRAAVAQVERAIAPAQPFDPRRAELTLRVAAEDYTELVVLAPLVAELARTAPGIKLEVLPSRDSALARLVRGEVDCGLATLRDRLPPGVMLDPLFEDQFVCMVAREHAFARKRPTVARFARARHALIAPGGQRGGFVDDALSALGEQREVTVMLPHFLVMPFMVAGSDLVLTLGERIARVYADLLPVALFAPPLALPGFTIGAYWHQRDANDPALAWLRERMRTLSAAKDDARAGSRGPARPAPARRRSR